MNPGGHVFQWNETVKISLDQYGDWAKKCDLESVNKVLQLPYDKLSARCVPCEQRTGHHFGLKIS